MKHVVTTISSMVKYTETYTIFIKENVRCPLTLHKKVRVRFGRKTMLNRFTITTTEKILFCLLLTFPLVDYMLRNWVTFGGGLWDKAVILALLLFALINKLAMEREPSHLKTPFIVFILFG